jgi:cell division protein FtsB
MGLSGLCVLFMLASGLFGARGVRKHRVLQAERAELTARRAQAAATNARLAAEVRALRESRVYVEWVIRQELGWIRPGERVLRLE